MNGWCKSLLFVMCAVLLVSPAWAAAQPMTEEENRGYAIGINIAKTLKQQGLSVDIESLVKGMRDGLDGKSRLADDELAAILQRYREEVQKKQEADREKAAAENQRLGEAFRAEYAKREGVVMLPGKLMYRVLQAGTSEKATGAEYAYCNYRSRLVNGKEVEVSSPDKPARIKLEKATRGLREAIREMTVGAKWEIVIPHDMAYGLNGAPPAIGPNETLIYELELVRVD